MTMKEIKTITQGDIMQIRKDCPYLFQKGRFFIPIEKEEETTKGLLVYHGNLHYLTVRNEFLITPKEATSMKVASIMNREIEQDRYEAFEFMSAEVKYAILALQKLVTKYHPNLSVWNLTSSNGFIDELEDEMIRTGVAKDILESEVKDAMQQIVSIFLKIERLDKFEENL